MSPGFYQGFIPEVGPRGAARAYRLFGRIATLFAVRRSARPSSRLVARLLDVFTACLYALYYIARRAAARGSAPTTAGRDQSACERSCYGLDLLGSRSLPFLSRRNYRIEFYHLLFWGVVAGVIEGNIGSIVVAKK